MVKGKHCVWRSLQMKVLLPSPCFHSYFLQPFWILGLIFQTSEQLINTIDDEREITNLAYTDTEQNPHQKFVDFPELVLSLQLSARRARSAQLSASSQSILHTLKSFSLAGSWQHHWKEGRDRQALQRRGKSWQCVNWKLGQRLERSQTFALSAPGSPKGLSKLPPFYTTNCTDSFPLYLACKTM